MWFQYEICLGASCLLVGQWLFWLKQGGSVVALGSQEGVCLERYPGMAARSDSVLLNLEIVPPRGLGILWT